MAAYGPAVNRIKYLITGEKPFRHFGSGAGPFLTIRKAPQSPATISGGPESIYSYRLKIAWKDESGDWIIHPDDNSPTTNRHIRAARMALEELGYVKFGAPTPNNELVYVKL
jgi:hypothetical protein